MWSLKKTFVPKCYLCVVIVSNIELCAGQYSSLSIQLHDNNLPFEVVGPHLLDEISVTQVRNAGMVDKRDERVQCSRLQAVRGELEAVREQNPYYTK